MIQNGLILPCYSLHLCLLLLVQWRTPCDSTGQARMENVCINSRNSSSLDHHHHQPCHLQLNQQSNNSTSKHNAPGEEAYYYYIQSFVLLHVQGKSLGKLKVSSHASVRAWPSRGFWQDLVLPVTVAVLRKFYFGVWPKRKKLYKTHSADHY